MSQLPLIGLVGHAGAGKDTAAAALSHLGYENIKFAGALKVMIRSLLDYQGMPSAVIDAMLEGSMKDKAHALLGDQTPRHAMQTLGTQWGRMCMVESIWTTIALVRAVQYPRVVISDCRFLNEAARIRQYGGMIVRIDRPGLVVDLTHESEREIPLIEPDLVLTNDTERPEQFQELVRGWFEAALARDEL